MLLEMSLEELKEYRGISPKADDFDEYWERALSEMRSVEPAVEIISAGFQTSFAECYDLYFTGVRGARIHVKYMKPKGISSQHPAIIEFHGYGCDIGDWSGKLKYVAQGYSYFGMDCRGQGGSSEDLGGVRGTTKNGHIIRGLDDDVDNLLFRHIFLDAAQLAGLVMDRADIDENRVGIMGYSQGGGLTLACASLEPRVKKLAPVYPFLTDYQRATELDISVSAYAELRDYFRRFDPLHKRREEIFSRLSYIDVQNLVDRIKGEVLMATGLADEVCPPSTQLAAYNKIRSRKEILIYPDFGHEDLPHLSDYHFKFFSEL